MHITHHALLRTMINSDAANLRDRNLVYPAMRLHSNSPPGIAFWERRSDAVDVEEWHRATAGISNIRSGSGLG